MVVTEDHRGRAPGGSAGGRRRAGGSRRWSASRAPGRSRSERDGARRAPAPRTPRPTAAPGGLESTSRPRTRRPDRWPRIGPPGGGPAAQLQGRLSDQRRPRRPRCRRRRASSARVARDSPVGPPTPREQRGGDVDRARAARSGAEHDGQQLAVSEGSAAAARQALARAGVRFQGRYRCHGHRYGNGRASATVRKPRHATTCRSRENALDFARSRARVAVDARGSRVFRPAPALGGRVGSRLFSDDPPTMTALQLVHVAMSQGNVGCGKRVRRVSHRDDYVRDLTGVEPEFRRRSRRGRPRWPRSN